MRKTLIFLFCGILLCTGDCLSSDLVCFTPPSDSRTNPPSVTFAQDGTLWMAWSSYQDGRFRIVACSRNKDQWSSLETPDSSLADQIEPQILIDSAQNPVIVYTSFNGKQWSVVRIRKSGSVWGKPKALGLGLHPSAVLSKGSLWVAWERDGQIIFSPGQAPNHKSSLVTIGPEEAGLSYSAPILGSGLKGEIWLVWTAARFGRQSVLLQRIDERGHVCHVVDDGEGINRNPQLSVDRHGRVWVVYESLKSIGTRRLDSLKSEKPPVYILDKYYAVDFPSHVVRITDGTSWWTVKKSVNPAPGLMPNIFCSSRGSVWLVSRSFTGYEKPYKIFCPVCESIGPEGWINHGIAWLDGQSYKAVSNLAEAPDGRVWAAWAQHDREKRGYTETPSWTQMDGPDFIAVAPMPELEREGLPSLIPFERIAPKSSELPALPRYQTSYQGEDLQVYFGDLHQHSEFSGCGLRNGRIDQNQQYSRFVRGLDFMCTSDHAEHLNDHTWRVTQLTADMNYKPDRFVTFAGFEWTSEFDAGGNLYRGHYNAVFRGVNKADGYFSASDVRTNTPLELWTSLQSCVSGDNDVLTFPHHTSRRMAWLTWNYYDPEMVPLIEIAQARGSYEYEGCFTGLELDNDITRVRGHYIHDGLSRGMRWGFVASGDHGGRQLTAVFAPRLDRGPIFQSLKSKRTYATSGEHIFLDVRVNGHFMGEEFRLEGEGRKINIHAAGTAPLVEIDIFRNGRSIRKWIVQKSDVNLEWEDLEPLPWRESYYYVRVLQADGGQAWSSPIWIINPDVEGEFQFQVGGDELRVIYPDQETDFAILMHNESEKGVKGRVFLEVPEGWSVKEEDGIEVECPAGSWCHAVFHVAASSSALSQVCLPSVKARIAFPEGRASEDSLFVVGSPKPLSREQKAFLIDARHEVPAGQFQDYFEKIANLWRKEF